MISDAMEFVKANVMKRVVAITMMMRVCLVTLADGPKTVDLGGPRDVVAIITENRDDYEIKVSLTPVRCFDSGLNRKVSQEKGRSYAVEALLRHLESGTRHSATMSNVEIIKVGIVDKRFVLDLRVPRSSVRLTKLTEGHAGSKPNEKVAPGSSYKAKDDYQQTLDVVEKTLDEDLPKFNGNVEEFYRAISDVEELGVTRLTSLHNEIKSDRWLLRPERRDLLQTVVEAEKRFLSRLHKQVILVETNAKGN